MPTCGGWVTHLCQKIWTEKNEIPEITITIIMLSYFTNNSIAIIKGNGEMENGQRKKQLMSTIHPNADVRVRHPEDVNGEQRCQDPVQATL